MKDSTLESPSFDFTSKVMSQVLATKTSEATTYKPLISKQVFIALFGSLAVLVVYILFNGSSHSPNGFIHLDYNLLRNHIPVNTFSFSKITVYSVVLTTIMLFIQIPLLKNYFDRKFNI